MEILIDNNNNINNNKQIVNKESKVCVIIDIAIPCDIRVCEKETEKVEKYKDLRRNIAKIWKMKELKVVIGAL